MSRLPFLTLLVPVLFIGCQRSSTNEPVVQYDPPASAAKDLETRYSVARVREQEGKLSSSATILKELVTADPQNADYSHRYGIVLSRLGDFEEGLKWLTKADALSPDDSNIMNDLGYACLMTGRSEQAQQVFATALELDPQNTRALNNLALAHGYAGDYDQAHELFLRTMSEAEAMSNLAYVATQSGNKDFAIDCYSRALDLNPELREAKEGLVQLAELEHRLQERQAIARATHESKSTKTAGSDIQQASHEDKNPK